MQLDLFQGEHVPLLRCHAALDRGDLRDARAALAEAAGRAPEASFAERMARLEARLAPARGSGDPAGAVQEAFEAALAGAASTPPAPGGPAARDWFRLYAAHMAEALAAEPERRVRGWCALHFELAAGRAERAARAADHLTAASRAGWAWLEAARAAGAVGAPEGARRLALVACLRSHDALAPEPPALHPGPHAELNEPAPLLPRLAVELEELFGEAHLLELAPPASAWVPALGVLAGLFPPALLRSAELREASGFAAEAPPPPGEPPARAFLRALLAAREARSREGAFRGGSCGEGELRARSRMRELAPALLARYLEGLAGGLPFGA